MAFNIKTTTKKLFDKTINFFFIKDQGHSHDIGTHLPYIILYMVLLLLPIFLTHTTRQQEESLTLCGINLPGMCMSKEWFDIDCPGCGLTRSFTAITHGDIARSYQYHRVGLILYLFFVYQLFYHIYCLIRLKQPIPEVLLKIQNKLPYLIIALLLANWLINTIAHTS